MTSTARAAAAARTTHERRWRAIAAIGAFALTTTCGGDDPADTMPRADASGDVASHGVEVPRADALLERALDQTAAGYHFETTVQTDGAVARTVVGDLIGDGMRMSETVDGETIDYVVLPTGSWIGRDGLWERLAADAPSDPLAPFSAPLTVDVSSAGPDAVTLIATYPPAVFGVVGDDPVDVIIDIVGERLASVSYASPEASVTTLVRTVVGEVVSAEPIVAPES